MEIVACTDKNFIFPMGVMMYSLCQNNQDAEIVFHIILDEDVTTSDKNNLQKTVCGFRNCRIAFYAVNRTVLSSFPDPGGRKDISLATYYRLMLTELLPDTVHKVLYLDGDIIIRGSLKPLWDLDLTDSAVAGATDAIAGQVDLYNRLHYPPTKGYFNAGVLLINLDYWREHKVINLFNDFINNRANDIIYHDQDVLNGVFWGCKKTFPIKYNFNSGFLWKRRQFDYWQSRRNSWRDYRIRWLFISLERSRGLLIKEILIHFAAHGSFIKTKQCGKV